MKLNNNLKLLLGAITTWFFSSIILILTIKNSKLMAIIFCIMSILLVLIIYKVLYSEFYKKPKQKK